MTNYRFPIRTKLNSFNVSVSQCIRVSKSQVGLGDTSCGEEEQLVKFNWGITFTIIQVQQLDTASHGCRILATFSCTGFLYACKGHRTIRHMLIKFLWISVEKANARLEYVNTVNPQQLHGHRPHRHCQQKLISNELLIVFKCLAMFYTFTTNKYLQQSCCTWGCVTIASPLARLTCTSSGLSVHMELSGGWVSLLLSSVHLIA